MFSTLITKELRFIMASPKFTAMFAVCSVLLLLSVFVGTREYEASVRQYESATGLVDQEMREARQWMAVNNRIYRRPDPMQIFAAGVEYDVGRASGINAWTPVKLLSSAYGNDPIYALFRTVDLVFIISVVLTLFAILFSFDAVNGEREQGTLALVFSNAVPRARYLVAKFIGSWLGLVVPLLVPLVLGVGLVLLSGAPMQAEHWLRLAALLAAGLLLFTFFLAFGILVSSLTARSNVSFLVSLTAWIVLVLIVPRAGVMAAGQIVPVPTVAEVESRQDSYSKDRWERHMTQLQKIWREREGSMEGLSSAERKAKREEMEWTWAEEDDVLRKQVQADIEENARVLEEEFRNRKREQERLAFLLSRLSPVSAFQLAAINLAGTDVGVKPRYEDGLRTYRTVFNEYRDRKQKESGSTGGIRISVDSETGIKIDTGRDIALDLSDLPRFRHPAVPVGDVIAATAVDLGILGMAGLLAFAGAFVAFVRYDVR